MRYAAISSKDGQTAPLTESNCEKIEAFADDESGELGWLVKARQREFIVVDNGEIHYTWAPVRTAWFHAPSYEAAQRAALDWAEQYSREVWGETDE
ncbi:hypothetical protein BZM26_28875 [Paraburkholderia strydomiana]|nr:hypothetical protein BZM26_28875 [Paraburkholderia strydomiana]